MHPGSCVVTRRTLAHTERIQGEQDLDNFAKGSNSLILEVEEGRHQKRWR